MHNLSAVHFVKYHYMFSQDKRQSSKKNNKYQLLYPYGVPPDDGLKIRPKHVEVDEIY